MVKLVLTRVKKGDKVYTYQGIAEAFNSESM